MKKILKAHIVIITLILLISFNNTAQTRNYFFGEFKIKKTINYRDSAVKFTRYIAYSNLYSDSVSSSKSYTAINCGQIFYNNIGLRYNSIIKTYMDSVERKTNYGITWSLLGGASCNNFTTTLIDSLPSFNYLTSLPSQLNKSQNLHITLDNCKYTDEIEIIFFDGHYSLSNPSYRKVNYTNNLNQIVIPQNDLCSLSGSVVSITISLIKNEYKRINGKNYKFEKRYDYVKPLPLIN